MAKEIQFVVPATGTHYVVLTNDVGQWYNTGSGFEAFNGANWTSYDIAATQVGTSKLYTADMPAVASGFYNVTAFAQAGGSPAATDEPVAAGDLEWGGSAVFALDDIPAAWGASVIGNGRTRDYFLQGGFNKTVRASNSFTVYSTDDTTVLATGPATANGTLDPLASVDPT